MSEYQSQEDIEGMMDEILGDAAPAADTGASGWLSTALSAAGELGQKGLQYQQSNKASADDKSKLDKSIQADIVWANAEAVLDLAQQSKDATKIAAAQALQGGAFSTAVTTAQGLTSGSASKRTAAAQAAATTAAQDALQNSTDLAKQAKMRAWQKVAAVAGAGGQATPADLAAAKKDEKDEKAKKGGGGNFLTAYYGGLPVYGWAIGGLTITTGLVLLVRSLRSKKRR